MSPLYLPLNWADFAQFFNQIYLFLENIRFTVPGGYISLFDCITVSAITGGIGTLIYFTISGGGARD